MADHGRAQLRARVLADLAPLAGLAQAPVDSRLYNFQLEELPGALVYALREESRLAAVDGRLERDLDLVLELHLAALDATLDDRLDAILLEAEQLLAADFGLAGLALRCWPARLEIGLSAAGEQPLGLARQTYRIVYRTDAAGEVITRPAVAEVVPAQATAVRTLIRARALATLAAAGLPNAPTQSRVQRYDLADLPAVALYTLEEAAAMVRADGRLDRVLTLAVEVQAAGAAGRDAAVDALCLTIEQALAADFRLGGLAHRTVLRRSEFGADAGGEVPLGGAQLAFDVAYLTELGGALVS